MYKSEQVRRKKTILELTMGEAGMTVLKMNFQVDRPRVETEVAPAKIYLMQRCYFVRRRKSRLGFIIYLFSSLGQGL